MTQSGKRGILRHLRHLRHLRNALARAGVLTAAVAAVILLMPVAASALTFHWIGGATGNWNDPAEWDTIDAGGSEAAWPSTAGDFVVFPASIASAVTVTIPTGVNAAFGAMQILTSSAITIQRAGTGQIIINTLSEPDSGDINIQGTGDHVISAPVRMDKHLTVNVANVGTSLVFSGGIGQTSVRHFNKLGLGTVRFAASVNNTYTGFTTAASGVLDLQHSLGATAIAGPLFVGGGLPPPNTATVRLLAANQIANTSNVTVRSDGTLHVNGFSDTIAFLSITDGTTTMGAAGDLVVSGLSMSGGVLNLGNATSTFTLQGNVSAFSSALGQASINSTGGTLSLSGADRIFAISNGPAANDLVINAPITGAGGERLIKEGSA
jgi:autotransporter-associated beta strand protein